MTDVLLAAADLACEADLVRVAPVLGLRVMRRCVDAVALVAASAQAPGVVALVSAGLPRLSADTVHRLAGGRQVIGLADSEVDANRLQSLGVEVVVRVGPVPEATWQAVVDACTAAASAGVWGTGVFTADGAAGGERPGQAHGRLVAVWGPMGAPGRTTIALGIAEALADSGLDACLVDADTYAPGVAMALGIVEDASGLVVACRHADAGSLTPSVLAATARRVHGRWSVLGGLTGSVHWRDLRPGGLERVWSTCRATFDVTIVDVGFCVEDDEADGAWGRRRNATALTALGTADQVVAVADASARGAARLAQAWPQVTALVPDGARTLVRNRAAGRGRPWVRALQDAGVTATVVDVPDDPAALQRCWEQGTSLGEAAPRSRLRPALAEVAARIVSG